LIGSTGILISDDKKSSGAPVRLGSPNPDRWHPLTRSLLERARRVGSSGECGSKRDAERAIRRFAGGTGNEKRLALEWVESAECAHDHLSGLGLDALLDIGPTSFWGRARPPVYSDEKAFDRAFEVRMMANELLSVERQDRMLMAPKLLAKATAMTANLSNEAVFEIRAVSAQIGWLETSLAYAAAHAISNVEALLSMGESERSVAIDHQLKIIEIYEGGLMATWEVADTLICVTRSA